AHNAGPLTGDGNNTYLFIGDEGDAMLVDAGVGDPRHLESLRTHLALHRARLSTVLVTHGHSDHAGGATAIAGAYPDAMFYKYPWPEIDAKYPLVWKWLVDGDRLRVGHERLTVIHTPEHSPDHVALWHDQSRTIFTGDLVIPG